MKPPASDLRRFSYGGRLADLVNVAVWKFDVVLPRSRDRPENQVTCYVKHAGRGEAFRALFARWPGATIMGTGLPLTEAEAQSELCQNLDPGAVVALRDLEEINQDGDTLWWGG